MNIKTVIDTIRFRPHEDLEKGQRAITELRHTNHRGRSLGANIYGNSRSGRRPNVIETLLTISYFSAESVASRYWLMFKAGTLHVSRLEWFAERGLALRATIPKRGENRKFSLYPHQSSIGSIATSRLSNYADSG